MFPSVPRPSVAQALDVLRQLEDHARMPVVQQRELQTRQLHALLSHAVTHSPFWAQRLEAARRARGGRLRLADLPPLTREELQRDAEAMRARAPWMDARAIRTLRTSGSTGRPVEVDRYTAVEAPLYAAGTLLDERWHARDPSTDVALIRDMPDAVRRGWGGVRPDVPNPGRSHSRNLVNHAPEALWSWLSQVRPGYLSTTPAMALRLAELALRPGEPRLSIAQIVTFGEPVTDELRRAAMQAFGAKVVDRYSCEELGWIALQCPKHDHLHVFSANVVVEVVDDDGRPCAPGQAGRVLLTGLNSWAMPLVRYDIGDRAEPGDACDCGMTLPVLRRVLGRERSFIRMPDGSMRLARLTGEYWRRVAPVSEYRVVQYADGLIEGFVTAERALSADEVGRLRTMLRETLGYPGEVLVTQVESIPWESRWKRIDVARVDRLRGQGAP